METRIVIHRKTTGEEQREGRPLTRDVIYLLGHMTLAAVWCSGLNTEYCFEIWLLFDEIIKNYSPMNRCTSHEWNEISSSLVTDLLQAHILVPTAQLSHEEVRTGSSV